MKHTVDLFDRIAVIEYFETPQVKKELYRQYDLAKQSPNPRELDEMAGVQVPVRTRMHKLQVVPLVTDDGYHPNPPGVFTPVEFRQVMDAWNSISSQEKTVALDIALEDEATIYLD